MSKVWLVLRYEYLKHVLRKRFLFALFSVPLIIVLMMAVSILATTLSIDRTPIGFVDLSGFLANPRYPQETGDPLIKPVQIEAFPDETAAHTALESGKIQAYYVLAADYPQTGKAQLIFNKEPDSRFQSQFADFLRYNLLSNQPAAVASRLAEGDNLVITSLDGSQKMSSDDWFNILIPIVAGVLFIIIIMTSGGYLLQAVVEEKENRTMEIIVTSVSPGQLMAGKIIGNLSVGLTQMLFWILFAALGLLIGRNSIEWIQRVQISPGYVALMLATLLPSFVLIAALMATIGATVTEAREAQQISGLFTLPFVVPYWFMSSLMTNPNGAFALFLSYFPLTAPVTLPMRAAFTSIPPVQLATNLALLYLCAAGAIWLAARSFRLGMLRYGKRLSLREIFARAA
jgi:ABC-2 type transport system permease protein